MEKKLKMMGIVLVLALVVSYFTRPTIITHPVYAEVNVSYKTRGKSVKQVVLIETKNYDDCEQQAKDLEKVYGPYAAWHVISSNCTQELSSRHQRLMEKKGTTLTYLASTTSSSSHRNLRIYTKGVGLAESNLICTNMKNEVEDRIRSVLQCIPGRAG